MSNGSFDVNFTTTSNLYNTPFTTIWGNSDEHSLSSSGLWLGSSGNDYTPMGIMQSPSGASAGEGYGLYSFTARYEYSGQGAGDYLLLWRADNQWLDGAAPGLITEMDMLETFDNSKTAMSTLHYFQSSASSDNGYTGHGTTGLDLTKLHVYSMDWEAGSLTFYIDGKQIYQVTGSTVPTDYAHGGSNQVMGMGAENENSPVGMYVTEAQYTSSADLATSGGAASVMAAQIGRDGATTTTTTTTSASTPSGPVTDTAPIAVSAPGTVQEASAGAGVVVSETITGTPGATVYEAVFTSTYGAESNWTAVTLNGAGKATINTSFQHSGDFLVVASDTSGAAAVNGYSSAITITDAAPGKGTTTTTSTGTGSTTSPAKPATIAVSAPGSVQEASAGAGVTVTETITATGLSTVYAEVLTSKGTVESAYQAVGIGSGGTGTVSLHLANSGDYVQVVNSMTSPTVTAKSGAVAITDPVVTAPVTPVTPVTGSSPTFAITSITDVNNTLVVTGTRSIGSNSTVRDFIDGSYKGVVQDNAADGSFRYVLAAPTTAGTHTLELTLDQSGLTSSKSFTVPGATTTTPTPKPTISLSAPGSVQEAKVGAGVTVTETITTTNLAASGNSGTVYAEVLTRSGTVESGYQAVSIVNGTGTVALHLASSGDTVQVASSLASPVTVANSSAITITDPAVAKSFTISGITETNGQLVVTGNRAIGSASTVRDIVDGSYKGVIQDNAADGSFRYVLAAPATAGTHTLQLTLDQSNLTASMTFITSAGGTVSTGGSAGGTAGTGVTVAPTSTQPVGSPTSGSTAPTGLGIASLTEDKGLLLMTGDKETGSAATMREYMDGKYLGTLRDGMKDGAFSMHIQDVTAGAHVLKLTLDGSATTATYDFTKTSTGSITALLPAGTASAGTLIVANHNATGAIAA